MYSEQDRSGQAKRYAAPTLTVHGRVAELTASGRSGARENGKGKDEPTKKP